MTPGASYAKECQIMPLLGKKVVFLYVKECMDGFLCGIFRFLKELLCRAVPFFYILLFYVFRTVPHDTKHFIVTNENLAFQVNLNIITHSNKQPGCASAHTVRTKTLDNQTEKSKVEIINWEFYYHPKSHWNRSLLAWLGKVLVCTVSSSQSIISTFDFSVWLFKVFFLVGVFALVLCRVTLRICVTLFHPPNKLKLLTVSTGTLHQQKGKRCLG